MQENKSVLEIDNNGTKRWKLNDKFHRTDGPAIKYASGDGYWYLHGKRHRTDGPAVELSIGYREWWLNGNEYTFDEWLRLTPLSSQEKIKLRLIYAGE